MPILGIDYSVTSPSICVLHENQYYWFCFRQLKKHTIKYNNVVMIEYPEYKSPEQRYDKLATLLLEAIESKLGKPYTAYIEDFAFSASGKITGLAEATGVLKHKLYKKECPVTPFIASSVKKHGSGKGNASKREMVDAFKKDVGDIYTWFDLVDDGKEKIPSPISDCVDAYYVLQYGLSGK
jgi:Holliday junction resolvasome RuvABC endonuclease subunit